MLKQIIHIDLCTPNEFQDVVLCQAKVLNDLERPDFYFPSTPDEIAPLLANKSDSGFVVGAYLSGHLVGFATVASCPDLYYGYALQKDCAHYSIEDCVVMAEYRGCGTQIKLWNYIFTMLQEDSVLLCTIHPENTVSLRNAIALGFVPQMYARLFENSPRLILERISHRTALLPKFSNR